MTPNSHDIDLSSGEFTCVYCGKKFSEERDIRAHEFISPCDDLKKKLERWQIETGIIIREDDEE